MKKVLFTASEGVPFIKTGGLADVVGALPFSFPKDQCDCRVILPKYASIPRELSEKMEYITCFQMDLGWRRKYVGLFRMEYRGVTFYFIDNEEYFSGGTIYYGLPGDLERYAYFSKAVLASLPVIGFSPDIIHCHDWQTALIPVMLEKFFRQDPFFARTKSIMTVHNMKFQGAGDMGWIRDLTGLPDECFTSETMELYGAASYLKGGLCYADIISTVSETYSWEIRTPWFGERLEGILSARGADLWGIVDGIDCREYDPANDAFLVKEYTADNFRKEKKKNKAALQKELHLAESGKTMMIGIVSRLTDQKGLDLIACILHELLQDDIQLVVLGTGDPRYEDMFRYFANTYPEKVSANIFFSEELAHRIYASCDAFLMPSMFEPCGLSQMISMRYGTLPIVRETGGLKDTVIPYNEYEDTGLGFSFANYNAHEMLKVIRYAEHIFTAKKAAWNRIAERAMRTDFSWEKSASKYLSMYDAALKR